MSERVILVGLWSCLALVLAAAPRSLHAEAEPATSSAHPGANAGFADHLFAHGEYYRAITEYQRLLYAQPDTPEAARLRLRIGLAYLFGGELETADRALASFSLQAPAGSYFGLATYGRAVGRYRDGDFVVAAAFAESVGALVPIRTPESAWLMEKAAELATWSYIKADRLDRAAKTLESMNGSSGAPAIHDALLAELDEIRAGEGRKSSLLAGSLSIVPGLGHVYLGQHDVAFFALALNSLFAYAATESFLDGSYGTGLVLSLFEVLWYSGTMFGAVSGTHKYNRDLRQNQIEGLEERYPLDLGLKRIEKVTAGGCLVD